MKNINYYLNTAVLILIFVAPISTALTNLFVGIVILLWILEGGFSNKLKKLRHMDKSLIFFISVYVMEVISLLWSNGIQSGGYWSGYYHNALDFLFRHEFFYVIVTVIIYTSFKKEWTEKAIDTFIYSMMFSEIVSYGIIFGLWTTSRGNPGNPSPFINHSAYSALLAFTIFLLVEKGMKTNLKWKKILFFAFSVTATLNLLLNVGRTGQLIFVILLVYYMIKKFRVGIKTILAVFVFLSALFYVNYKVNKIFIYRVNQAVADIKSIEKRNYATSWGSRYMSILLSKKCLETHPVLGYGFADAKKEIMGQLVHYNKKAAEFYRRYLNPDMNNQYLQFFNEIGFVGLGLFLMVFYFFFKNRYKKDIDLFARLFMIDYFFMFFTGCFLRFEATFILFIIFITIFILNKEEDENTGVFGK